VSACKYTGRHKNIDIFTAVRTSYLTVIKCGCVAVSGLDHRDSIPGKGRMFIFAATCTPRPVLIQPSVKWVSRATGSGGAGRGTHLHLLSVP
jgi:hypothetical protein